MIKHVYCITRKDGMSAEEFHRTWRDDHGPLVKSFAEAINAVRYVQSHTVMEDLGEAMRAARGAGVQYDGVTEVWWNSREELEAGFASEAGQIAAKALLEDESRFIEFSKSRLFVTEEHEVF